MRRLPLGAIDSLADEVHGRSLHVGDAVVNFRPAATDITGLPDDLGGSGIRVTPYSIAPSKARMRANDRTASRPPPLCGAMLSVGPHGELLIRVRATPPRAPTRVFEERLINALRLLARAPDTPARAVVRSCA
jgi:hypothetical protein